MSDSTFPSRPLRVWDLPTRIFHWALVGSVVVSIVSIKFAGNPRVHTISGYIALGLIVFRIVWGFIGPTYARFSSFLRGPGSVLRYAGSMIKPPHEFHAGHNPLGGLMVAVMLLVLLFQATTGLFANDDIATDGPLAKKVTKEVSDMITSWHRKNSYVIYAITGAHVLAVFGYLVVFRENLIRAMVSGVKDAPASTAAPGIDSSRFGTAAVVAAIVAAIVWFVVNKA